MSLSSQVQNDRAAPSAGATRPPLSRRATVVWLLQLLFPTIGLAHFLTTLSDHQPIGRFEQLLLAVCLLWYAGCFLGLFLGRSRSWLATHTPHLCVLYVSLGICLAAAEVVARASLAATQTGDSNPRYVQFSPELGWSLIAGMEDIGEHGWRGHAYPPTKAPGHFRIVCVGDSTTFCMHCALPDTWPQRLEAMLNADAEWSKKHGVTEVLNLGVPGFGPDQALIALQKYGLAYAPDVVIYHLCMNDFADVSYDHFWLESGGITHYRPFYLLKEGRLVPGRERVPLPKDAAGNTYNPAEQTHAASAWGGARLAFPAFLRDRVRSLIHHDPRKKLMDWPEQYWPIHEAFQPEYNAARPLVWALVREMARVAAESGAVFLITLSPTNMNADGDTPPWRVTSFQREFEEDARAAGVSAVNPVPEYFARGGNDRFAQVQDKYHLNAEGNALIAETTLQWFKKHYAAAKPRSAGTSP